jgi:flavin-dependent dehydrogenase
VEDCRVTQVEFLREGPVRVQARTRDGAERTWNARFLVDASGRDTFLASRLEMKQRNRHHASSALYSHFTGAKRFEGRDEGNISIYWFEHGWFWFIPLRDGTTSVGAVCWPYYMKSRKSDPTTFLHETIALCPPLQARLKDATLTGPATATGNYSYEARRMAGDRYLMVGDAFAFVDPVFSSGVMLAMNSAVLGADVVDAWLRDPRGAGARLRDFDRQVRKGLGHFKWFIYRMTSPAMRDLLMNPRNDFRIQEAVISLLAGDLFGDTPIGPRLLAFKCIYYLTTLGRWRQCLAAWRRRKRALREPGAVESVASAG